MGSSHAIAKAYERLYLITSMIVDSILRLRPYRDPQSILVIKLDEIGDMVLAMHTFEMIKRDNPHVTLTILCKPFVAGIVATHPSVDRVIGIKDLGPERYDVVVDLRGSWPSLRWILTHPPLRFYTRARVRARNKATGHILTTPRVNISIVEPLLRSTIPLLPKIEVSSADRETVGVFLRSHNLDRFAVIHPGARRPLKQWPPERFSAVIHFIHEKYGLRTVITGGPEDRALMDSLCLSAPMAIASPADFTLLHLAALCERASLFVGNDSGPMHIASTFGMPLVGIFGPGVPGVFDPIGEHSTTVHHVLPCNPCDQITCTRSEGPCILLVSVDEVCNAIGRVMSLTS
ncbi:MAG: glycosyltransferase family 9 protein [Ignavibacteria bacterium]|nr:glycosyltransferase family 9 protein [Ignavibacteria bacterium]